MNTAACTRFTLVLLTVLSAVCGLVPLASSININLLGFFSLLKPDVFIGGRNVAFWRPLAFALIFGLTFATFLTLIGEPGMYYFIIARKSKTAASS